MYPTRRSLKSLYPCLLIMLGALGVPAGAATIVADDFNDVANAANISGRAPTTTVNGATWLAPTSNFIGNGAGGLSGNSGAANTAAVDLGAGYLSANPGVYDLKLDINQPSGLTSQSWIAVGFARGTSPAGNINAGQNLVDNNGSPWVLFRLNGQEIVFAGPANTNTALMTPVDTILTGENHTFELQLDTSTPAWTLNAFVDGVQQDLNGATDGNTFTFAANPTASHYVTMATGTNGAGAVATVDNFILTGPVPEPGAATLAIAGVAMLATRRARR